MAKHGIEGDPDDYCLVQLISGGGINGIFALFKKFISYVYLTCFIGIQILLITKTSNALQFLAFRNIHTALVYFFCGYFLIKSSNNEHKYLFTFIDFHFNILMQIYNTD